MTRTSLRPRTVAAILALTVFGGLYLNALRLERRANGPHGRYTKAQIMERSEPLLRTLVADGTPSTLAAYPTTLPRPGGRAFRMWRVHAIGPNRRPVATLIWDAQTGKILSATPEPLQIRADKAGVTSEHDAARLSVYWMSRMGLDRVSANWRMEGKPKLAYGIWRVHWQADGRDVRVSVSAHNGRLIRLNHRPPALTPLRAYRTASSVRSWRE